MIRMSSFSCSVNFQCLGNFVFCPVGGIHAILPQVTSAGFELSFKIWQENGSSRGMEEEWFVGDLGE